VIRVLFLAGVVLLLLAFRSKSAVVFGLLWVPVTFLPTIIGEVSDRSFYIPSLGVALVLGVVLTQPFRRRRQLLSLASGIALAALFVVYSAALLSTNLGIRHAGDTARAILKQIVTLHPNPVADERLVFVGLPDQVPEGPLVFLTGFRAALRVAYPSPLADPIKLDQFPIWLDNLDKTYFFQVNHRNVTERRDLVQALRKRAACSGYSAPLQEWNFADGPAGWEPWNHLSDWSIRDGALSMRATGDDPNLGSPSMDIPALTIGEIAIKMKVTAKQPALVGEVYWLATGQPDFSPGLAASFQVLADGQWHSYQVDLAKSGMLLLGDQITQLRLDPTNAPAEIAIQSITISTHCSSVQNDPCNCAAQ
jgi:hypothetical protein